MENSKENSVMDERIVRMNAILSTKLSAVSKGKREGIKAQKSSVRFILDSWDDANALNRFISDEEIKVTQYELYCIAKSRVDEILAKLEKEQEEYLRAHIDFKRLAEYNENPGDLTKLENKVWAILHGYYDDDKVMREELEVDPILKDAFEYRKNMPPKQPQTKKSVTTKVAKKTTATKAGKSSKHNVGDLHPNGKWVWTEYKPGKFDWRGVPKDGSVKVSTKKTTQKKSSEDKQPTQPKKKRPTLKEFQERCEKGAGQGLTKTQKEAKKLLLKGYKIESSTGNNNCFLKKDGEVTKSSFLDAIEALFRKMGMTGIPSELFIK